MFTISLSCNSWAFIKKNHFSKHNTCMSVRETVDLIGNLLCAEMPEIKVGLLQYILSFVTGINKPLTFSAASILSLQKRKKNLIFMFNLTNKTKNLKIQST